MSYLLMSYHPEIRVGSTTITGELNDYYTDDEILAEIRKLYDVDGFDGVVTLLPLRLDRLGYLCRADDSNSGCHNDSSS